MRDFIEVLIGLGLFGSALFFIICVNIVAVGLYLAFGFPALLIFMGIFFGVIAVILASYV